MLEHRSQSQKCPVGCEPSTPVSILPAWVEPPELRGKRKSLPPASHSKDAAQLGFAHFGRIFRTMVLPPFPRNTVYAPHDASRLRFLVELNRRRTICFLGLQLRDLIL